MRENKIKRKLLAGEPALAITLNFVHAGLAEYLGVLGYDAVIVDGEHGVLVDDDLENFARACDVVGVTPMLRMPPNNAMMQRYTDIGIQGFHVPNVRSAREAQDVVDAVKFAPLGKRGLGAFRATNYGASLGAGWPEFIEKANAQSLIKCNIEDPEGFAALPEIVKVEGVDVIGIGTTDLSNSLGFPGQRKHPKVVAAIDEAFKLIKAAGKIASLPTQTTEDVIEAHRLGAMFISTNIARVIALGSNGYLGALKGLK